MRALVAREFFVLSIIMANWPHSEGEKTAFASDARL
jgi:hypothetical protein